jgi:ubiquinone/menaquinone biosynthesis C-methylase UbiE
LYDFLRNLMTTSTSRDHFNPLAERYLHSSVHRAGPSLPVLVQLADPTTDDFVLDVATGPGSTAFALADHVRHVTAVDIAPRMLEQGRLRAKTEGKTNISFQQASAEALPFATGSFSLVVSRHAPHHFGDAEKFLREVGRVLCHGGRFVLADQISPADEISEWWNRWEQVRDPSHFIQRTASQWQELAASAGLLAIRHQIVPYRLEFDWWVTQAGCDVERVAHLERHFQMRNPEVTRCLDPTFDGDGKLLTFIEPILVARFERAVDAGLGSENQNSEARSQERTGSSASLP